MAGGAKSPRSKAASGGHREPSRPTSSHAGAKKEKEKKSSQYDEQAEL